MKDMMYLSIMNIIILIFTELPTTRKLLVILKLVINTEKRIIHIGIELIMEEEDFYLNLVIQTVIIKNQ